MASRLRRGRGGVRFDPGQWAGSHRAGHRDVGVGRTLVLLDDLGLVLIAAGVVALVAIVIVPRRRGTR